MKQLHLEYSGTALAVSLRVVQTLCKQGDAPAALLYLYLVAHEGLFDPIQTAHDLHMTPEDTDTALRNLAAAGALDPGDIEPVSDAAPAPVPPPEVYYTRSEVAEALRADGVFAWLVRETETCAGRPLRQHETEKLFWLYDTVRLKPEVIPLLVHYVAGEQPGRQGLSFSRLLTVGRHWADRGVNTLEDAEALIAADAEHDSRMAQILQAAGVHNRTPSPTERRYAEEWTSAGYLPELVERAYDITVTKTGGVSWRYTASILSRWHTKGIRRAEDVDRLEGSRQRGYYRKKPSDAASQEEDALYARLREQYLKEQSQEEQAQEEQHE